MRFFANANYDFLAKRRLALAIVAMLTLPGLLLLLLRGVNYSIEFTGGTLVRIETREPVDIGVLRGALDRAGMTGAEIQRFGSDREFAIRAMVLGEGGDADNTARTTTAVAAALDQAVGAGAYTVASAAAVGPKVGSELRSQAAILILLSLVAVLAYLAFRFEWRFGVAAVIATIHDVVATIAFIGLVRIEVSLFVVGGILSIVGYSLNDTIVVLDRVRENLRKLQRADFQSLLNRSVNETLPRTVFTGSTALGSLLALAALGGDVVRPFALVMLVGVLVGTFSSIYIVGPVLLWIERRWPGPQARGVRQPAPARAPTSRRPEPVA
jgi:preprotein translocase subunit SecF